MENDRTCIVSVVKGGVDLKMTPSSWLGLVMADWAGFGRGAGIGKWSNASSPECIEFGFPGVRKWQCVIRSKTYMSGEQEKLSELVVQSW